MLTTAARLVYFHRRGLFSAAAWRDLVARAPHKGVDVRSFARSDHEHLRGVSRFSEDPVGCEP